MLRAAEATAAPTSASSSAYIAARSVAKAEQASRAWSMVSSGPSGHKMHNELPELEIPGNSSLARNSGLQGECGDHQLGCSQPVPALYGCFCHLACSQASFLCSGAKGLGAAAGMEPYSIQRQICWAGQAECTGAGCTWPQSCVWRRSGSLLTAAALRVPSTQEAWRDYCYTGLHSRLGCWPGDQVRSLIDEIHN